MNRESQGRSNSTRRTLIEATISVIAAHGLAGVTTRRVAEQAELPLGSLHYWFASKEALLDAVAEHVQQATAVGLVLPEALPNLDEQIGWLFERTIEMPLADHLAMFEILAHSMRRGNARLADDNHEQVMAQAVQLLEPWRDGADAQLPGGFAALVTLVHTTIIGTWFGHFSADTETLRGGIRLLGALLRDVPRDPAVAAVAAVAPDPA
ncbi:TetR/AcrR family transcriptional regulator [Leucobacter sp. NPDC077196]|uniref:TetR/AcrR family transcriptional regulator n=1 Tax=Leucobacter sp. NPDC077196 TaxID=3154959 RepID=UPI00341ECE93